jgi:membrane protease YdiL (CAAX protease family)
LVPGSGEAAVGDYAAFGGHCLGTLAPTVAGVALVLGQRRFDPWSLGLLTAGQDTWFYGIYAAYRDARRARGNAGYAHPIPDEDFLALLRAPFSEAAIAWEVAVPAVVAAGAGIALSAFSPGVSIFHRPSVDTVLGPLPPAGAFALHLPAFALIAMGAAIGEEALFRGLFQAGLDEWIGPIAGTIVASLLFASVHLLNPNPGGLGEMLVGLGVRTALGAYLGWLFEKEEHRLSKGVAFHFWYDMLLLGAIYAIRPAEVESLWNVRIPGLQ